VNKTYTNPSCLFLPPGGLIYLLDMFCNSTNPTLREQTAELFAKILSDKLVGPKVRIIVAKFLPAIFMDAMRESPEASVHMFEGQCHGEGYRKGAYIL